MSNILLVGYITEGKTDKRFLESVIKRTFEDIAFDCTSEIIVYDVQYIDVPKIDFVSQIEKAATQSFQQGVMVLCVHVDADTESDKDVFINKIEPAFNHVNKMAQEVCKNLVAVVPIQMTEAWMLADIDLIKDEIGTTLSNETLGLNKNPEIISDPKDTIKEAIRLSFSAYPKRRNKLQINELYAPIGQKISLQKLGKVKSYIKFRDAVRQSFINLNYLN
jgi:Domain of unknown function (DUF4276)